MFRFITINKKAYAVVVIKIIERVLPARAFFPENAETAMT